MKKSIKPQKKKAAAAAEKRGGRWGGWLAIMAAAAGLGICLYLFALHVSLLMGDIKDGILCGTENGMGCHAVAASPYSSFLGLPLAAWGAIFYGSIIFLAGGGLVFRRDSGPVFYRWALGLALLALAFDLYLAYVMLAKLGTVCRLCLATYIINFVIILVLFIALRQAPKPRMSWRAIFPWTKEIQGPDLYYRNVIKGLLIGGIILAAGAVVAGSQFLENSLTENDRERLAKIKENLVRQTPRPIAGENRPFMGAANAKLTVVTFSDFLCPYCDKAAEYLKLAEAGNHDSARFIFRHYPLDSTCNRRLSSDVHPGACLLAEGAACAAEQDRFWQYHDQAFETQGSISGAKVQKIAADIGLDLTAFNRCLDSGRGLKVVKEDIEAGIRAGIRGTPTVFVNGRRLGGVPKPWVLNEILQYGEKHLSRVE